MKKLLIGFHGWGETGSVFLDYAKLDEIATGLGAELLCPDGVRRNWLTRGENRDVHRFDEWAEGFDKVYVAGYSDGAWLAGLITAMRPVAGAVIYAGGSHARTIRQGSARVLLIRNDQDITFRAAMQSRLTVRFREAGYAVDAWTRYGRHLDRWDTAINQDIVNYLNA